METPKLYELSNSTLRVILFGDERLDGIRPVTKSLGDTAKVVILPLAIGRIILAVDNEELFHVELLDDHAEVWMMIDWKESNTYRQRIKDNSAALRLEHDKTNASLRVIIEKLRAQGFDRQPGFVEHLAKQIHKSWKSGQFVEMLKLLDLVETLEKLDKTEQ